MDKYTEETQKNLNERFDFSVEGIYFAHQPIYGYRDKHTDGSNISRYMITKSILNALNNYTFSNFIDIGGAEGYTANLVKQIFKVPVKSTDLSDKACEKATQIFGIEAVACDIHELPFNDNEFDAVLCSETLEHVTDFKKAAKELLRITNKILIITVPHETPEIVAENIRNQVPHGHIHYFDTTTFDYLKDEGYEVHFEKTLSPRLVIPRVIAEANKKPNTTLSFKLYNIFTPVFRALFGLKTANHITDIDAGYTKKYGEYGGLTFVVEKVKQPAKANVTPITAKDFTDIKVPYYKESTSNNKASRPIIMA